MTQEDDFDNIEELHQDQPDIVADPEPPDDTILPDNTPCISFHALNGFLVQSTLKIAGKIFGKEVVVLIDMARWIISYKIDGQTISDWSSNHRLIFESQMGI